MQEYWTDEEIELWLLKVYERIANNKCIECKFYSLFHINLYGVMKKEITLEEVFINIMIYLVKLRVSIKIIIKYIIIY
jgi:hypothetical protein